MTNIDDGFLCSARATQYNKSCKILWWKNKVLGGYKKTICKQKKICLSKTIPLLFAPVRAWEKRGEMSVLSTLTAAQHMLTDEVVLCEFEVVTLSLAPYHWFKNVLLYNPPEQNIGFEWLDYQSHCASCRN